MTSYAPYPQGQPRRLPRDAFTRDLVREHAPSSRDLIYPVFVLDGQKQRQALPSMPGVERMSLDLLLPVAGQCMKLGVPALALFPVSGPKLKPPPGQGACNPEGLIPRVVRGLKKR